MLWRVVYLSGNVRVIDGINFRDGLRWSAMVCSGRQSPIYVKNQRTLSNSLTQKLQ